MPDPGEEQILELLRRLGATDAEIAATEGVRSFGDLALELVLRDGPPVRLSQLLDSSGISADRFREIWQALALPALVGDDPQVPADVAATAPVLSAVSREWLGDELALAITRVVGTTAARLAEAIVDVYRVQFELPRLRSGDSYAEVVARQVEMTQTSVRAFEAFLSAAFRAHLVRVASGAWAPDEGLTATRRELFVGFVDLVGYTALARTMSTGQLARLLSAFEDVVGEAVGAGGGRLVKLIGDSAMFVTDSPAAGCRVALDLCRRLEESDVLPAGRGGGDYGTVLSLRGDYFGDVVNRAARFVALARSATVVVSDVVAAAAGAGFTFERLPPRALKGFQSPMAPFRVLPG